MLGLNPVFQSTIDKHQALLEKAKWRSSLMGYIKLGLFILFAVCIYFMVQRWDLPVYKIEAAVLLVMQVFAWVYHVRLGDAVKRETGIIDVNRRHQERSEGKWTAFGDTGAEFMDPDHPYCGDLDIVGKKSLFQYLNVTHTFFGRHAFVHDLLDARYGKEEILRRQEAVEELAADNGFGSELEYRFSLVGNDPSAPELVKALQSDKIFLRSKVLRMVLLCLPFLTLLFTGIVLLFQLEELNAVMVSLFALQLLIWLIGYPATKKYLHGVDRLPFKLQAYSDVLRLVYGAKWKSKPLLNIQRSLTGAEASASEAMRELTKITDRTNVRGNALVYFLLNEVLLWDLRCAFRLERWRKQYALHCEKWFLSLGQLESLSCFATLRKVSNHTCYPRMLDEPGLQAEEVGHPLISDAVRVTNPLHPEHNILIISGSNMSGKTTYLRTVGINVVLARAGAPVCARSMETGDFHILTSMRIADDLNEGVSSFYAELRRIKAILDAARRDRCTLFLIDEIFRGTNSVDRLQGARTVITKLCDMGISGMVTTHDLELCALEHENANLGNVSFSEQYENGEIRFDYKIRPGRSRTSNAQYLMEMLGII